MRRSMFLPLVAAGLGLSACAGQPDTPQARIAHERHENFEQIGDAFKAVNDELKDGAPDIAAIRTGAGTIAGFAPQVAGWFPKGSGPQDGIDTDALQTVWTKPAEFSQASARFAAEAARFDALAKAGNIPAIRDGAQALGGTCKGCHDMFREKD